MRRARCIGLIPAHAGKTAAFPPPRPSQRAHPRSRGENPATARRIVCQVGSSPLTRGIPIRAGRGKTKAGLIPAHAGKTLTLGRDEPLATAHPRSRGENTGVSSASVAVGGSSPLTRGKLPGPCTWWMGGGLIPAHAGKTTTGIVPTRARAAHPRSRGENTTVGTMPGAGPGSSPLTRGKHHRRDHAGRGPGLIPAHAGKTTAGTNPSRWRRAHPRSRGENRSFKRGASMRKGSSPLTRGKPQSPGLLSATRRLIPAHAGKTRTAPPGTARARAHPRSRGEN